MDGSPLALDEFPRLLLRFEGEAGADRAIRRNLAQPESLFLRVEPAEQLAADHFENQTPFLAEEKASDVWLATVTEVELLIVSCAVVIGLFAIEG